MFRSVIGGSWAHGLMSESIVGRWCGLELRLRWGYALWDGGTMTIAPSLRRSSLLWLLVTQGAGSSTIIDGKLCLLYFGGLSLRLGRLSSSAMCLEETQQRRDKNPIASSVICVRSG